jgi:hypothetical protein
MPDVKTSESTTAPSNPDVDPTISKLLKGLQGTYDRSAAMFGPSLNTDAANATRSAWDTTLDAAGNPAYGNAISGAMSEFGDIAAGNRFGDGDSQWQAVEDDLSNRILSQTNNSFNNSGLFGSDSNQRAASEGLGSAIGNLRLSRLQGNEARQERAASYLPALFQGSLAPGAAMGGVAASMRDTPWDPLLNASAVLGNTAGAGGTESSKSVPWWAAALGAGTGIAGLFG